MKAPRIRIMVYEREKNKFDTNVVAFVFNSGEVETEFIITAEITRDTCEIVEGTLRTKSKRAFEHFEDELIQALITDTSEPRFAAFFEGLGVAHFSPIRLHTFYVFEEWNDDWDGTKTEEYVESLMENVVRKLYYPYEFLKHIE